MFSAVARVTSVHLKTGARQPMVESNFIFETRYDPTAFVVGMNTRRVVLNDRFVPWTAHPVIRGRRSGRLVRDV